MVLNTNSVLVSLSRQGDAYPVWKGFQEGRYTLCVTTEILEEYEEVIARNTRPEIARNVIDFILKRQNVLREITFPRILVLKLKAFIERLKQI